jgi:hypothetical protein
VDRTGGEHERRGSEELGDVLIGDVQPRLPDTPGRIRHPGLPLGAANREVYGALGLSDADVGELRTLGVV